MYAIIEACGRQYKVKEGEVIYFEKLDAEEGKKVTFDNVLLLADKETTFGAPYVKGAKVEGKVLAQVKGEKISIFKYKPKKGYRKRQGHRQNYTRVEITKVSAGKKSEPKKEEK